ncbi:N-formylglutamate amidohydrolase [Pelagibius sp. Alg239-R121]|uniref:N-formylglutamate amidohydrolase n=1 Tax=Pelagibius sp. Alg239-R121 TaxID=2993448 RepID=UPI0024A64EEA|nr:N-formylglutamate amidohydrolase [Pelagibius sp. Alg239-R121]
MQREGPEAGLLAGDEPAPVEFVNSHGTAPVVLVCDHASRFIPRALDSLGLDEIELARHIAWDIGAAEVTRHLARLLDAPAVISHFSRLVVDPNRKPDSTASIPEESDGIAVPGNKRLLSADRTARLDSFFHPYQNAIADTLAERRKTCGMNPVLLSIHSFTPVMEGVERPWKLGILWSYDPRLAQPLIDRLRAAGITVGDNEPYSGREGFGYTTEVHGDAQGVANALIEIRQDLIDTHHGAREWAGLLGRVLKEALKSPELYKELER